MLHNVMQSCLSSNRWDEAWIDEQIDEVLRSNLSDLVKINFSVEQATKEVKARAKGLQAFSQRYISDKPKVRVTSTHFSPLDANRTTHRLPQSSPTPVRREPTPPS